MAAPGTQVQIVDEVLARFPAADPSAWFVVGFTEKGPTDRPVAVRDMDDFVAVFGERVAYSNLYDALDVFFREGGGQAYVLREVGPTPVEATANIFDQSGSTAPGDVALVATAKTAGEWFNEVDLEITVDGTDFQIEVVHDTEGTLETSPVLADRAAAVAWESNYVDLTLGASNEDPRAQTASLASGADDHASATDAELQDALDLATSEYGPGLVSAPGQTTDAVHEALLEHAVAKHRTALLDSIDSAVVGDLVSDAQTLRAVDVARGGGLFAPWVTAPGEASGTTRTVPPSALVAGLVARNDATGESVNQAAAGRWGAANYVTGLSQEQFAADDLGTLNDEGVNVIKLVRGVVQVYGYRTLVDPDARPNWVELSGSRTAELIANLADSQILARYVFSQLDGRGHTVADAGGELVGLCLGYYAQGALYGDTPEDAFFVDVGETVNTPASIAERRLRAKLSLKTSPFAERVELTISKQAVA